MSRGKAPALIICLALAACGASHATFRYAPDTPASPAASAGGGGQAPINGAVKASPGRAGGGVHSAPGGGSSAGGYAGGAPVAGNLGPPGSTPAANPDNGNLGDMSRGFLRPTPYTHLTIEMDVAGNAAPSSAVAANLVAVLGRESQKQLVQAGHAFAGKGSGCWSDSDILQAAASQRQTHTQDATASLLVLFVDGTDFSDSNILGLAFGATEMVVFSQVVENLSLSPTVGPDVYMKSVTVHELGHIVGLVNIGYHSTINHEDSAHPHHSSNQNSVMYYAIDQGNLVQQFASGPPTSYDSSDEADLNGLRTGAY